MAVDVRHWWGHGVTRARSFLHTPRAGDWLRALPAVVNVALVLLIASTAAELTWSIFAPQADRITPIGTPSAPAAGTRQAPTDIRELAGLHLFGEAAPTQTARAAPIDAPETRLNLDLRGIFASSVRGEALAIIGDPQGKEKPYREGDALPGGAELHEIYADRVILDRGGQLETLKLRRSRLPGMGGEASARAQANSPPPAADPDVAAADDGSAAARLQALREQYSSNPDQLWNEVRITPVMGDGGVRGYTLLHQDAELMGALGLRPDDIITAVNGMSLSDPSVMYDVMNNLASASELSLSIERNGTPQTLHVSLN